MTLLQTDGTPLPSDPAEPQSGLTSSLNPLAFIREQQLKKQLLGWVETEFMKAKNKRSPFEQQWQLNLAFVNGRQYVSPINIANAGFRMIVPKAPPWRVRLVINKIRMAVRTECAKLTSSKPIPVVVPSTTEDEDYAAARIAERIVRSHFTDAEFQAIIRQWVWWGSVTGVSYLKQFWDGSSTDPNAQEVLPPPLPGMAPVGPQPAKGVIQTEVITPFHIYVPDLLTEDLEKQPFVIHATTKSPDWIERNFGFKPTPDARAAGTIYESAVLSPRNANNDGYDSVMVKEVWIKPGGHPAFPQGGLLTVCGGRFIQYLQKWPLPFAEYPFYKYDGIPTGSYYTESVVTDLIPIQKEYNRTKSQMIEIKNTMGKPKFLAQRGSINPRQITSEPGQAVLYTPGFEKPTVLAPAEVPATMQVELDRLNADFDDISGQHEITRGNAPSQVSSGTAINFLQEQDDSKLAYQVASIERNMSRIGTHYLKLANSFWSPDRTLKIVGVDNEYEIMHWHKARLKGETDVRIQSGSALPFSKAAKQAFITDLMQNGLMDPQTGLEILDLAGLDKAIEDFLVDKRQAQRENMKMADADPQEISTLVNPPVGPDGQPIYGGPDGNTPMDPVTNQPWQPQPPLPVNSYDNHQAHIHFHNQFRKTQQFELLDDNVKKLFELHVQAHQYTLGLPQVGSAGVIPQGGEGSAPQGANPNGQVPQPGESGSGDMGVTAPPTATSGILPGSATSG